MISKGIQEDKININDTIDKDLGLQYTKISDQSGDLGNY